MPGRHKTKDSVLRSFKLDIKAVEQLDELAAITGLSRTVVVEKAIEAYAKKLKASEASKEMIDYWVKSSSTD